MSDLINVSNETIAIMSGKLIIGNHDTITLFGMQLQNKVNDITKDTLSILLKNNNDIYECLNDIVTEIDEIDKMSQLKCFSIFRRENYTQKVIDKYIKTLNYIEKTTLFFKLQQAQLIKEIAILKEYESIINECIIELEQCIQDGNKILMQQSAVQHNIERNIFLSLSVLSDVDLWFKRLEKRLKDLNMLRIIALQNVTQIKLLYNNNLLLIDRVIEVISTTFPHWKIQMNLMFGLEAQMSQLDIQNELLTHAPKNVKIISAELDKKNKTDIILELNRELSNTLNELMIIETTNINIRNAIKNITLTDKG